jgi:hypothetical protein
VGKVCRRCALDWVVPERAARPIAGIDTKAALRWKSHGAADALVMGSWPACKEENCYSEKCVFALAFQQLVQMFAGLVAIS